MDPDNPTADTAGNQSSPPPRQDAPARHMGRPEPGPGTGAGGEVQPPGRPHGAGFRSLLASPGAGLLIPTQLLLVGYVGASALDGSWSKAVIPALLVAAALVPPVLELAFATRLPRWLHGCYAGFLLAGPFAGGRLGLYGVWGHWDKAVHFFSGLLVGCTAILALGIVGRRKCLALPGFLFTAAALVCGGFVAAVWEIAEYTSDHLVGTHAQNASLEDTMTDIICGVIGAAIVAILAGVHHRGHQFPAVASLLRDRDFTAEPARQGHHHHAGSEATGKQGKP